MDIMGKKTRKNLSKEDISKFTENHSDFGFEIKVLRELENLEFECQHGGTYLDPITNKPRQFDIRAIRGSLNRICLAVECKNIKQAFPLVALTMPRQEKEAYHCLIRPDYWKDSQGHIGKNPASCRFIKCADMDAIYGSTKYGSSYLTCKSIESVWEENNPDQKSKDNILTSSDSEIYDRWAQAINSSYDLVAREMARSSKSKESNYSVDSFVLPLLVVPDGILWQVVYDEHGANIKEPVQVDHIAYYVGHDLVQLSKPKGVNCIDWPYQISHLHIVTLGGLKEMLGRLGKLLSAPLGFNDVTKF